MGPSVSTQVAGIVARDWSTGREVGLIISTICLTWCQGNQRNWVEKVCVGVSASVHRVWWEHTECTPMYIYNTPYAQVSIS